jgi:hypothetical protein
MNQKDLEGSAGVLIDVLSQNLPGVNEEYHEKPLSR